MPSKAIADFFFLFFPDTLKGVIITTQNTDFIKHLDTKCFLQQRLCLPVGLFSSKLTLGAAQAAYTLFIRTTLCATDLRAGCAPASRRCAPCATSPVAGGGGCALTTALSEAAAHRLLLQKPLY